MLSRCTTKCCKRCSSSLPCKTSASYFQLPSNITDKHLLLIEVYRHSSNDHSKLWLHSEMKRQAERICGPCSVLFPVSLWEGTHIGTISTTGNPYRFAKMSLTSTSLFGGTIFQFRVAWILIRAQMLTRATILVARHNCTHRIPEREHAQNFWFDSTVYKSKRYKHRRHQCAVFVHKKWLHTWKQVVTVFLVIHMDELQLVCMHWDMLWGFSLYAVVRFACVTVF